MANLRVEWRDRIESPDALAVPGLGLPRPSPSWAHEPVRFGWGERMQDVAEVLDRWPGEGHCYFRIRAADGALYIIRYDEPADEWQLIFFRADA